jgi:hypothetical protein
MDQSTLVENGHNLIDAMATAGIAPRGVMWVHNTDADVWRLWIVPSKGLNDKREFYRRVSEIVTANRNLFTEFDAGDVEMLSDTHPAIVGLSKMFRIKGKSSAHLRSNMVNGFYIPDGIVLLMDI